MLLQCYVAQRQLLMDSCCGLEHPLVCQSTQQQQQQQQHAPYCYKLPRATTTLSWWKTVEGKKIKRLRGKGMHDGIRSHQKSNCMSCKKLKAVPLPIKRIENLLKTRNKVSQTIERVAAYVVLCCGSGEHVVVLTPPWSAHLILSNCNYI